MDDPEYIEPTIKEFVAAIYRQDPNPPHSLSITLPEQVGLKEFLAYFICYGARELYGAQLAELSPEQIGHLRKYLWSLGWDVEYTIEQRDQTFESDTGEENTRRVNYFLIDFKPAERSSTCR